MELYNLTIKEAHEGLVKKEFSSEELTKATFGRIKEVDDKVQAFLELTEESALVQAKRVDEKNSKGEDMGPLAGVPMSIKDVIVTKGVKTTAASKMLENYTPPYDATLVSRLKQADAVMVLSLIHI